MDWLEKLPDFFNMSWADIGRVLIGAFIVGFLAIGWVRSQRRHAAERVADAAVKAIYRNRRLVTVEPFAKFMYAMKRYAPWLMDFVFQWGRRKRAAKKAAHRAKAA